MEIGDFANTQLGSTVIGGLAVAAILGLLGLLTKRGRHWIKAGNQWVASSWVRLCTFLEERRRHRTPPTDTHQHADPTPTREDGPRPISSPTPPRPLNVKILNDGELRVLNAQQRNAFRVRLEIVRERNEFWAPWALKNWGPGDAYSLYVTPKSSNFKLDQELWDELRAKEEIPLFRHWPSVEIFSTDGPQLRVEYTDSQGKEHILFIDVPTEALY